MNDMTIQTIRPIQREQEMQFGTQILPHGVRFSIWAPDCNAVSLKIYDMQRVLAMKPQPRGWFELEVEGAHSGMRYRYVLENGTEVPDPASRFQPEDVHGPSEIIDPRDFDWTDVGWRGQPWEETIFYELHVGTFTPEGTFRAAMDKLDYLKELGITAIELMPIADFAGRWNWGYDGVSLFAPDNSYGRPEDLKALINAAHGRGLSVFLDVVYNHFGPEGNYLNAYAPLVTDKHSTPWGEGINFDDEGSEGIRHLMFANARYWLNEYRFDGLRFDAVHAIKDDGPRHMLQELVEQVRASTDGRFVHLIVENSDNHANWMKRRRDGAPWLYDAQWNDDVHHTLHTALTGEDFWYYEDYAGRMDLVGRSLAEGFAFQGEYFSHEDKSKGQPSAFLPPTAFVAFAQNHDHIGNRPFGERIGHLVEDRIARVWAAIYLLSPQIPLLFMGEEWNASSPFPYFSDVSEELADPIRQSRKDELKKFPGGEAAGDPPDPMAEATFNLAKLKWDEQEAAEYASRLTLYRHLIALRKTEIVPRLVGIEGNCGSYKLLSDKVVQVDWMLGDGSQLTLTANLSDEPFEGVSLWSADHLWLEGFATGDTLEGWSVVFTLKKG